MNGSEYTCTCFRGFFLSFLTLGVTAKGRSSVLLMVPSVGDVLPAIFFELLTFITVAMFGSVFSILNVPVPVPASLSASALNSTGEGWVLSI